MRFQAIVCSIRFLAAIGLALWLLVVMSPDEVNAQVAAGTIQGSVSDNTGAVFPNATVLIENLDTGIKTNVTTNEDGIFSTPNLLPGNYRVSATAKGFGISVESSLSLAIGAVRVVNFSLKVGSASETVEVGSTTPDVDTSSSQLSGVIGTRRINDLPLNGRDWTQLATLEPGVSTIRTQQSLGNRVQQGEGTLLTVAGGRPWQNNYRLDGTSINDYANGAPGSALGTNLGVDAVQEFSVLTSNYPAEYGRSSGGIINAITRSGTNLFHGTAYEFLRNSALDAKNYFDSGAIPPFKRNQFGGSAGGPILKDRTFIFGDYEGVRQSLGTTQIVDVPTQAARNGVLSTGTVTPDPTAVAFLDAFYPLPDGTIAQSGDTGQYSFTGQQVTHENYFTTRVDHKVSPHNSLFGTYVLDRADTNQPDELNNKTFGYLTRRQIATIEDGQTIGSAFVNAIRFGVNRVIAQEGLTTVINPAAADLSLSSTPGLPAPQIQVPGLVSFTGGLGGFSQHFYHYTSYQGSDDAFLTKGVHSIKFGVSFEHIRNNEFAEAAPNGLFKFGSLPEYIQNIPKSFTGVIPGKASPRNIRESVLGLYIQDDWRARPNLTINLGLRYEMSTVPTEVDGKLSTLRSLTDTTPHLGSPFFNNPTERNFEPRVGFAYDPFRKGKTSVRGGAGIFDVLPLPYLFEIVSTFTAPFYEQGKISNPGQGTFPAGAFAGIASDPTTLRAGFVDPHPPRSYVMHWNLSVQQQLAPSLTAMIAYAGSRGIHQPEPKEDVDTVLPTLTSQGYLYPDPSTNPQRINENFGRIGAVLWNGDSYYHSLQVKVTKNMTHNFQIQGSYTWSHSIDTGSTSVGSDAFGNSLINPIWFDPSVNRGPSDFDLRHNLTIHFTWNLPRGEDLPAAAKWALGGWQLGGIFQASSGVPFNALLGGDPLGQLTSDNSALPDRLPLPTCSNLTNPGNPVNYIKLQCFAFPGPSATPGLLRGTLARNALFGPGLVNLDLSLIKDTYVPRISERFNLQFRIEAFNILNHPNFAPPLNNSTVFDETGSPVAFAGQIDSTQTPSRQIQLGIKAIW